MKLYIKLFLIIIGIILGFNNKAQAYITVASTSYSLEVGADKFLAVPNVYDGYIDHAVWACSKSEINFKEKDAAGAIIQISRSFSGTAVIELLATEKYLDSYGRTRARTYYKQYLISCIGGGPSVDNSEIILPESISLNLGETKRFNILSGNCYNGAFRLLWKNQTTKNFAIYEVNYNTGVIDISGAMPGEGILNVKTANENERDCKIIVKSSEITTGHRSEKIAIADIKSLIATVLPIAKTSGIKDVEIYDNENMKSCTPHNHIFNMQGVLLKLNATPEDVKALCPGLYIIGGKKTIIL